MKRINYVASNEKNVFSWHYIVKTILFTILITAFLILSASFMFNKLKLPVDKIRYAAHSVYFLSFALCGFIAGISSEMAGWKSGLSSGVVWVALLLILGLYDGLTFGAGNVLRMFSGLVTAIAGGILGVNYRYSRKKKRNKIHK